jgi:hypothetical protein
MPLGAIESLSEHGPRAYYSQFDVKKIAPERFEREDRPRAPGGGNGGDRSTAGSLELTLLV